MGVNKLAPTKPLNFGDSNIAVVYGDNGSGKSGYVRLLKHICGVRNSMLGPLHKNTYSTEDIVQKAKVSFLKNDSLLEHKWLAEQGVYDGLRSVDIFDTSFDKVFIGNESEVSYEPQELSFFSTLIDVCARVANNLDTKKEARESKMPNIPDNLRGSAGAEWLEKINAKTSVDEFKTNYSFTQENQKILQSIRERISELSPTDKAKQFTSKREYADGIITDFVNYFNQLSDKNCKRIIVAKKKFILKKSVAKVAAKDAFNDAKLEGIGFDVWKELWNTARTYSEELAYKGQEFPVILDDSVCVLCHQPLTEKAKQRFTSFESYIKGEAQKQAVQAEKELKNALDDLPDIDNAESLKTKMDAAGIENQEIIKALTDTAIALQDRKTKLPLLDSEDALTSIDQTPPWIEKIQQVSKEYEHSANQCLQDATKDNQEALQQKLKNIQARQWLSEQKPAIQEEVSRLQAIESIQQAKKTINTTSLSRKKGELANMLITEAFVQRFNDELGHFGSSRLKVKLIKSKVDKGKVLHTLKLEGTQHSINDVLSEGEKRIISIAAFLADVTGRDYSSPLVFDDPISSLDQNYEEAVVRRLCDIASNRQIIIFTHRLSLLNMIQDYAQKANIKPEIVCIRDESWGTGEPGDTPFSTKNPNKALNTLIVDALPKAKKLFREEGKEAYEHSAKVLCMDFRSLLERMIEYELLSGVVYRHQRAIQTMGKICKLAKISETDCTLFDDLMTKYSRHLHSQSPDAPVPLPEPEELEFDFKKLKQWQTEFKNRS